MLAGRDFLELLKEYFRKNASQIFFPLMKQTQTEGLSKYPVFLVTNVPVKEESKLGVLVKTPTFEYPFFVYLSTLEVLRDKGIFHQFNIENFKKQYGEDKAAFVVLNGTETYVVFVPFPN